jgi:hypothetical protein
MMPAMEEVHVQTMVSTDCILLSHHCKLKHSKWGLFAQCSRLAMLPLSSFKIIDTNESFSGLFET